MSGKTYTEDELANMSDDELMGMAVPPQMEAPAPEEQGDTGSDPTTESDDQPQEGADEDEEAGSEADDQPGSDGDADADGDTGGEVLTAPVETEPTAPAAKEKPAAPGSKDGAADKAAQPAENTKPAGPSPEDLKAFYDKVMAPFKANGKDVQLQSPDEAVRLMQMGANYTKKLQALQPNMKLLKMLENNGLLDEGKLSYLIDLDKKNPAAIQKFIKESGVDPLEIDTSAEPTYKPGNHKVSDEEMVFKATIDEVMLEDQGAETIVALNRTWDAKSKESLYADPNLIRVMHEQRKSGIYQKISDEIERRKIVGALPVGQPFIQTYYAVGKEMDAKGLLVPTQAPAPQTSRVLETRPATRKTVANDDKAKAASPTNSTTKKVVQDFNPLSMSDEEFEKNADLAKRL